MCGLHAWVPCSLAVCGSADLKRQQEIGNGVGCPFNSAFLSRPWEATAPVSPFLQPGSLPPGSGNLSSPRPFRLKDGRGSLLLLAPECFAALAGFRLPVHHLLIKLSLLSPLSVLFPVGTLTDTLHRPPNLSPASPTLLSLPSPVPTRALDRLPVSTP